MNLVPPVFGAIVGLIINAYALPRSQALVRAWVRLYTFRLSAEIRERRREEMTSHLYDEIEVAREAGYRPSEVGLQIMFRLVRGAPSDLLWSAENRPLFHRLFTEILVLILAGLAVSYSTDSPRGLLLIGPALFFCSVLAGDLHRSSPSGSTLT